MLDRAAFPHIFDRILQHAPPTLLIRLRLVSRELHELVDERLFRHVVLGGSRTAATQTGQGARNPVFSLCAEDGVTLPLPQRPAGWWNDAVKSDPELEDLGVVARQLARTRVLDVADAVPWRFTRWFNSVLGPPATIATGRMTRVFVYNDLRGAGGSPASSARYPLSHVLVKFAMSNAEGGNPGRGRSAPRAGPATVVHHLTVCDVAFVWPEEDIVTARVYYFVFEQDPSADDVLRMLGERDVWMDLWWFTRRLLVHVFHGMTVVLVGLGTPDTASSVPSPRSPAEVVAARLVKNVCWELRTCSEGIRRLVKFASHAEFNNIWSEEDLPFVMLPRQAAANRDPPAHAPA